MESEKTLIEFLNKRLVGRVLNSFVSKAKYLWTLSASHKIVNKPRYIDNKGEEKKSSASRQ